MNSAAATRFSELVNEELRALMGRRGMTQQQLAEALGISQSRVSKMIFKNESSLSVSHLDMACNALNDDPSEVLRRAERALAAEQNSRQSSFGLAAKHDPGVGADINDEDYF